MQVGDAMVTTTLAVISLSIFGAGSCVAPLLRQHNLLEVASEAEAESESDAADTPLRLLSARLGFASGWDSALMRDAGPDSDESEENVALWRPDVDEESAGNAAGMAPAVRIDRPDPSESVEALGRACEQGGTGDLEPQEVREARDSTE